MPTIIGWALVALFSVLIAVALARLAPRMAPIKRGSAEEFWEQACHFQPREAVLGGHGHVYPLREGWFVYDIQHMHGSDLYCVPEEEVEAVLDQVTEKLRLAEGNPTIYEHARVGFEKWLHYPDHFHQNADTLVAEIRRAHFDHYKKDDPGLFSYLESEEWSTRIRWHQSKWYWSNIAFEWLFLSGLVLFAAWPFLWDKCWWSWAIHWGLIPMLFMLPVFLGYARLSFTSAGPTGGVIYPWLLFICHGGSCNDLDGQILAYTPQVLAPLSAPIGSALSLSGRGMPGPTTMVIAGLVIASLVFVGHKLLDRLDRHVAVVARLVDPPPTPEKLQ
jgi:hypothetical protein